MRQRCFKVACNELKLINNRNKQTTILMKKKVKIPVKKELFDNININPSEIWEVLNRDNKNGWSYGNWNKIKKYGANPDQFIEIMKVARLLFGHTAKFLGSTDAMEIIKKYDKDLK